MRVLIDMDPRDVSIPTSNSYSVELKRPQTECANTRRGLTHQIEVSDWRAEMHSTRRCSVDGCSKPTKAHGLCGGHYQQRVAGKAMRPLSSRPLPERLRDNIVESPNGCWEWAGRTNGRGYGRIGVGGRDRYVHRLSYEMHVGPIPAGLEIDHLCKNTLCVNPSHLEPVTHEENVRRSEWFVVTNAAKTHCVNGHEFTPETVYYTLRGHRGCLICRRASDRRRSAK